MPCRVLASYEKERATDPPDVVALKGTLLMIKASINNFLSTDTVPGGKAMAGDAAPSGGHWPSMQEALGSTPGTP